MQRQIWAAERDFLGAQLQAAMERHAQAADTIALLRSQLLQVGFRVSQLVICQVTTPVFQLQAEQPAFVSHSGMHRARSSCRKCMTSL